MQFFAGHGDFAEKLHERGRSDNPGCPCGAARESPMHVVFQCPLYEAEREEYRAICREKGLDWPPTGMNIVREDTYKTLARAAKRILLSKEDLWWRGDRGLD